MCFREISNRIKLKKSWIIRPKAFYRRININWIMFSNNKLGNETQYTIDMFCELCMNSIIYFSGISVWIYFLLKKITKLQRNYRYISLYKRVDWATRQVSKLMHKRSWSLKNASDIFKQFKESRRILFDLWKQWWCWQYRILTATIIIHKRIVKHIILTVMWTVLSFFAQRYSAEFIT